MIDPAIQRDLGRQLARRSVPGCSLRASIGGAPFAYDYGVADVSGSRTVDGETVFHLYSGTKLYTATALMKLVEAGSLSLDQTVNELLPDLPLEHEVTLRQLVSHCSGLRDTMRAFMAVHLANEQAPTTREALGRYTTRGGRPPGRKVSYRNINYALLGEVIERVSGTPYEDYVSEQVLAPLGVAAGFSYDEAQRVHAAQGTIGRWSPMRWLLRVLMPGLAGQIEATRHGNRIGLAEFALDTAAIGGLVGRARDFLPLAVEMLSGEDGILQAQSKETMLTMHAEGSAGIASTTGVGIGWKRGATFWNHEGGGPGFTSETRIYPDEQVAIVILMNATQSRKLSWLAHEVCEIVRSASG